MAPAIRSRRNTYEAIPAQHLSARRRSSPARGPGGSDAGCRCPGPGDQGRRGVGIQRGPSSPEHGREEYGRAVAALVRVFGCIDVAEEAVQDAFAAAVQRWPSSGLPPSPAGWIITTARNRAIDRLRREAPRDD